MTNPLTIIDFDPAHYEAIAEVLSGIYPEHEFNAEGLKAQDKNLPAYCKFRRWVGLYNNVAAAFGEYRQSPEMYHPNSFTINLAVHPRYQSIGIGSRLYDRVTSELELQNARLLRATARGDCPAGISFLKKRNFSCVMSIVEWCLEMNCITQANVELKTIVQMPEGFDIQSVEELNMDPRRNRKLYNLISAIREDVPLPESSTKVDYEQFASQFLEHPSYCEASSFVALVNGEYIGYSDLRDDGIGGLYGGLTGVRREYRRNGLATALKMRGIDYARSHGYHSIKTFNASENVSIGTINRNCGFVPRFEWMHFERIDSHQPEEAYGAASF